MLTDYDQMYRIWTSLNVLSQPIQFPAHQIPLNFNVSILTRRSWLAIFPNFWPFQKKCRGVFVDFSVPESSQVSGMYYQPLGKVMIWENVTKVGWRHG